MSRRTSRALWTAKIEGKPYALHNPVIELPQKFDGVISGVDRSLRGTGLALVSYNSQSDMILNSSKTILNTRRLPMAKYLENIFKNMKELLEYRVVKHVTME